MYPNNQYQYQQGNNRNPNQPPPMNSFDIAQAGLAAQMGMRNQGPYGQGGYNQPGGFNDPYGSKQGYGGGPNQPYNPYNQYNQGSNFRRDDDHILADEEPGPKLRDSSRPGFIRKVYSILAVQLTITAIMTIAVMTSKDLKMFLFENPWLLILSTLISIPILYTLGCYPVVARSVPINYILLFIFTICQSLMVACISSQYDSSTVMIAAVLTAAAVIGLTIYAFTTSTDLTMCGGFLFIAAMVLFAAGIVSIFIQNRWLQLAISIGATILFGIYLIYDTQLIIGNKSRALSIDDYIWAAMMLYIDIIQIFIHVLQLLGKNN